MKQQWGGSNFYFISNQSIDIAIIDAQKAIFQLMFYLGQCRNDCVTIWTG